MSGAELAAASSAGAGFLWWWQEPKATVKRSDVPAPSGARASTPASSHCRAAASAVGASPSAAAAESAAQASSSTATEEERADSIALGWPSAALLAAPLSFQISAASCVVDPMLTMLGRAALSRAAACPRPWRAPGGVRALSSRSVPTGASPEEVEEREQAVRKLVAQREELTSGRHSRRHFTPIQTGDQLTQKILEYESSARSNGQYKFAFKADSRHSKRSTRRILEANAGKWRAFKAQLNDSLATLLENRR